jgi:Flp pilus assembly protein TadG
MEANVSKDQSAQDAIAAVGEAGTSEEVQALTAGDERKTVRGAADARLAELSDEGTVQSTESVLAPSGTRTDISPAVAAAPAEALTTDQGGKTTVRVRPRWPVSSFQPNDGPAITSEGVEVDASDVEARLASARSAGTGLEVV